MASHLVQQGLQSLQTDRQTTLLSSVAIGCIQLVVRCGLTVTTGTIVIIYYYYYCYYYYYYYYYYYIRLTAYFQDNLDKPAPDR